MLENEGLTEDLKVFRSELQKCESRFDKLLRVNQRWDIGLTVSGIVFTLLTAVTGTLQDEQLLSGNSQKLLTGIFGAISVAVQSAATKFPVQERAKAYRRFRNDMYNLQMELLHVETREDLKPLQVHYKEALKAEGELP